jgi:hypothetical protein
MDSASILAKHYINQMRSKNNVALSTCNNGGELSVLIGKEKKKAED